MREWSGEGVGKSTGGVTSRFTRSTAEETKAATREESVSASLKFLPPRPRGDGWLRPSPFSAAGTTAFSHQHSSRPPAQLTGTSATESHQLKFDSYENRNLFANMIPEPQATGCARACYPTVTTAHSHQHSPRAPAHAAETRKATGHRKGQIREHEEKEGHQHNSRPPA